MFRPTPPSLVALMPLPSSLLADQHPSNTTVSPALRRTTPSLTRCTLFLVSKTYNFTDSGPGTYSFNIVSDQFHYVNDAGEPIAISAIRPAVHSASLSGKLASPRHTLPGRATYNGCSSSEETALVAAAAAAQNYASSTHAYTQSHTPVSVRYTTWFGIFSMARHDIVDFHFSKLNNNSYANYTYDCTCTDPDTFAYVFPDEFGKVFLCGAFWKALVTGSDSQGGTLIHEVNITAVLC